jgi:hypothetical protein
LFQRPQKLFGAGNIALQPAFKVVEVIATQAAQCLVVAFVLPPMKTLLAAEAADLRL